MHTLSLIVAMDAQRGIGIDNTLPWRLPEDLARFKRLTTGHPILMGRKTFESIGRPLPNRRNIVLSANPDWHHEGAERTASIDDALAMAGAAPTVYVIGGAQIYQLALPRATHVLVTEIAATFDCDTFFPALDPQVWREQERETHHSGTNKFDYAFVTYTRIPSKESN